VCVGSGCEVGCCGREVSIALVSVLAEVTLAVTCAAGCASGDWFGIGRVRGVSCVVCDSLVACGFSGGGVVVQSSMILT